MSAGNLSILGRVATIFQMGTKAALAPVKGTTPSVNQGGAPKPPDEEKRLEALRRYELLDTAPENQFDDLALLASHVCGTPIATVSLIDRDRQWFKAKVGIESTETPRDVSFCAHAILQPEMFVVRDAREDP